MGSKYTNNMPLKELIKLAAKLTKDVIFEFMCITPEIAAEMLKLNVCNYRGKKSSNMSAIIRDISNGNWSVNCEPIVFNEEGYLEDGQHRLEGIVKSGCPAIMLVIRNAPHSEVYDTGSIRSVRDMANAEGMNISNIHAAMTNIVVNGDTHIKAAPSTNIEYLRNHLNLIKKAVKIVSMKSNRKNNCGKNAPCAAIAYSILRTGSMTETELQAFFGILNSGIAEGLDRSSNPALVLRNQLNDFVGTNEYVQKVRLEATYKALLDFHARNDRKNKYAIDTNLAEGLLRSVHDIDAGINTAA